MFRRNRKKTITFGDIQSSKNRNAWIQSELKANGLTYSRPQGSSPIDNVNQVLKDITRARLLPLDSDYQNTEAEKIKNLSTPDEKMVALLVLLDKAFPEHTVKEEGKIVSHPVLDHYSQPPSYVSLKAQKGVRNAKLLNFPIYADTDAPDSVKLYEENGQIYYKSTAFFHYGDERPVGDNGKFEVDKYYVSFPATTLFVLKLKENPEDQSPEGFQFVSLLDAESSLTKELFEGTVKKNTLKAHKSELNTRTRGYTVIEELPPLTLDDYRSAPENSWIGQQLKKDPEKLVLTTNPSVRDVLDELKRGSFKFRWPHSQEVVEKAVDIIFDIEKTNREYQYILLRELSDLLLNRSRDLTVKEYEELERIAKLEGEEQIIALGDFNHKVIAAKLRAAQRVATIDLLNELFPGRGEDVLKHLCQYPAYFHAYQLGHATNGLIPSPKQSQVEIYTEGEEIFYKATSEFTIGYKKQSPIYQPCEVSYTLTDAGWKFRDTGRCNNPFIRDVELGRTKPDIRKAYGNYIGFPADEASAKEEASKIEQAIKDAKARKPAVAPTPVRALQLPQRPLLAEQKRSAALIAPVIAEQSQQLPAVAEQKLNAPIAVSVAPVRAKQKQPSAPKDMTIGTAVGVVAGIIATAVVGASVFGLGLLVFGAFVGLVVGWAKNEIEVLKAQKQQTPVAVVEENVPAATPAVTAKPVNISSSASMTADMAKTRVQFSRRSQLDRVVDTNQMCRELAVAQQAKKEAQKAQVQTENRGLLATFCALWSRSGSGAKKAKAPVNLSPKAGT